ncbi:hypothetical protein C8Q76DRAFT_696400 [Earliella scabrosa]|nr:hypothetical protein C8Q76DRAFT_696400 [Earliella scabrosa]
MPTYWSYTPEYAKDIGLPEWITRVVYATDHDPFNQPDADRKYTVPKSHAAFVIPTGTLAFEADRPPSPQPEKYDPACSGCLAHAFEEAHLKAAHAPPPLPGTKPLGVFSNDNYQRFRCREPGCAARDRPLCLRCIVDTHVDAKEHPTERWDVSVTPNKWVPFKLLT